MRIGAARKLVVAALPLWALGCRTAVECGPGTAEIDGVCMSEEGPQLPPGCCGPGTHYDTSGLTCAPDFPPRVCDVLTTVEEPSEDGVITCVGYGRTGCDLLCPQPEPGKMTVCGTLRDAETNEPIALSDDPQGELCDSAAQGGPCALELTFYDALEFSQNPDGAHPLPYDKLTVNDCGEFAAENLPVPALGYLGLGIDDATGAGDEHVLSGVATGAQPGERIDGMNAFAVRRTTDAGWTETAGRPFGGSSFSEKGAVLLIYLGCDGLPVEGVRATANGSVVPDDDFYFSDTEIRQRSTVDPALTATGPNGAVLVVDTPLVDHGGSGSEAEACHWPDELAKAIPGVVFVNERQLEDDGSGTCCQ